MKPMNKTTVIYHRADFDGLFCREIARKFLPEAELIGWDFADDPLQVPKGKFYVMDLPLDVTFGGKSGAFNMGLLEAEQQGDLVWIDHHASAIKSHSPQTTGYRIDGVAACRLAWQWFTNEIANKVMSDASYLPEKPAFVSRSVSEPWAVQLAGEYDIWDKRNPDAELFQYGLCSRDLTNERWGDQSIWEVLLSDDSMNRACVRDLLVSGKYLQYAKTEENASIIKDIGFDLKWEGLNFLACNAARYNSHLFTAGLKPEHDACFGFKWTGKDWSVSLYHAPSMEHHDLSLIASKYGGGGHRGACGFRTNKLPFLP